MTLTRTKTCFDVQALHNEGSVYLSGDSKSAIDVEWKFFTGQPFLKDALRSLTGLSRGSDVVATFISGRLMQCLHWLEETSR